jgi:hypothetical protein
MRLLNHITKLLLESGNHSQYILAVKFGNKVVTIDDVGYDADDYAIHITIIDKLFDDVDEKTSNSIFKASRKYKATHKLPFDLETAYDYVDEWGWVDSVTGKFYNRDQMSKKLKLKDGAAESNYLHQTYGSDMFEHKTPTLASMLLNEELSGRYIVAVMMGGEVFSGYATGKWNIHADVARDAFEKDNKRFMRACLRSKLYSIEQCLPATSDDAVVYIDECGWVDQTTGKFYTREGIIDRMDLSRYNEFAESIWLKDHKPELFPESLSLSGMLLVEEPTYFMNAPAEEQELNSTRNFRQRIKLIANKLNKLSAGGSSRIVYKINDKMVLKLAKNQKGIGQNSVEADVGSKNWYSIVTKVYDYDEDYKWIVSEYAQPFKSFDQIDAVWAKMQGCAEKKFSQYLYNLQSDMYKEYKKYDFDLAKAIRFVFFRIMSGEKGLYCYRLLSDGNTNTYVITAGLMVNYENSDGKPEAINFTFKDSDLSEDIQEMINEMNDMIGTYDMEAGDVDRFGSWGLNVNGGLKFLDYGLTKQVYEQYYSRR